ncbi:hypothetical protein CJP72_23750 [Citrobacter sp. NCU1]|uniref:hypothetical protein n=1 Tax=Citrobacter sp. NCU1 TaxID=2026683 RepID=UPI001390D7D7|nr:hypothetical protein [Citrobacter sp. NCU1]NDO83653.1 hypothetical protein [Citrobacter sp. NCU1]
MKVLASLLFVFILIAGNAVAAECSPKDAEAADLAVDHLTTWQTVNDYFNHYRQCDDGDIAEGSSEAVIRLLADKWETLPKLDKIIAKNPPLKGWVLNHINTTLDTDDLFNVEKLATSQCPSSGESLCKEIASSAHEAATGN